jgi:hypothetical protein
VSRREAIEKLKFFQLEKEEKTQQKKGIRNKGNIYKVR